MDDFFVLSVRNGCLAEVMVILLRDGACDSQIANRPIVSCATLSGLKSICEQMQKRKQNVAKRGKLGARFFFFRVWAGQGPLNLRSIS